MLAHTFKLTFNAYFKQKKAIDITRTMTKDCYKTSQLRRHMEPDKSKKLLPEENEIKNKQEEEIPRDILAAEDYYKGIILVAQNYTCDILEDTRYYLKKLNIKEARELASELYPTEKKLLYKLSENNLDCCECTFTKKPKTDEDLISQITLHTRAIKALSRKLFSINHDQLFNHYKYHTYRKPIVPDVQIMCVDIIYTLANMSYHQSVIKILHDLRNNPHFIRASTGGNEKPNTHKNEHEAVIIYIAKNLYQKNYKHYSSKKNKKGEAFIREITKDIIKLGDEIGYSLKVKPTRIEELLRNHFKIHYNIFFRNQKLILNNITSGLPNENQISKMENEVAVDKNDRCDAVIKEANIAFEVNKIILENSITISRTCINIVLDEMYQNEKPSITIKYYECKKLINSSEFNNEEFELILRMIARKDPLEALLAKLEKINESQPKNI